MDYKDYEIRRVIGNIGRAGIAMMISPQAPRIRSAEKESWEQINHTPFDGNPEDCFENISLHLSFTQYTLPIDTRTHGAQDTKTFLIESPFQFTTDSAGSQTSMCSAYFKANISLDTTLNVRTLKMENITMA